MRLTSVRLTKLGEAYLDEAILSVRLTVSCERLFKIDEAL